MDDPPGPSSSSSKDVFISFRGSDTRKSFVCHLHNALERQLVGAYLDTKYLRQGDNLSNLFKAIAEAKISIVVFSKNYATSTWCLKELVKIMECHKAQQKQLVIPIFYDGVEPSHVGHQKESFKEAFDEHKRAGRVDNNELERWRVALHEASQIAGSSSDKYRDDTKLIDAVVERVSKELNDKSSGSYKSALVGIQSRIQIMKLAPADLQMDKFRKVGIWGTGGIGKTTIAKTVYNQIHSLFQYRCVVENVKDKFHEGGVSLLKDILSSFGISSDQLGQINTMEEAYNKMKELQSRTVLVVLDDIDNKNQIDTLLDGPPFGKGSIVIVTTRDRGLLTGFDEIYEVGLLSDSDALILFSKNAFKTDKPPKEYVDLSKGAVKYAQGLPLALEVMGGLLGPLKTPVEWKHELLYIKSTPHMDIQNVLERSYSGLDKKQKDIFLDIACFFRGWKSNLVKKVLDDCGFHASAKSGIQNLVDRALITISKSDEIEMHDLIQEMGRQIESKAEDGKRKRFWSEDAECALSENTVTECAEGLMIDLPTKEKYRFFHAEAFERMKKLRLLIFTYAKRGYGGNSGKDKDLQIGDLKFLSSKLRVLIWHGYPLKCLPSNFDPENLLVLDLNYSSIEKLWEGYKFGNKLITNSNRRCDSLTEDHQSTFSHKNLVFLSLAYCHGLESLPSSMYMKSLETLALYMCENLEKFPEISEDMEALSKLILYGSAIKELPSSIDRLKGLSSLDMSFCKSLVCLPESICNLNQLKSLKLNMCSELKKLPQNIGSLKSLQELDVSDSGLEQLPISILHLKLSRLSFKGCQQMAAPLSSWPSSIEDHCTALVELDFSDCDLRELSNAIAHFSSLKVLKLSRNKNLKTLPSIMNELDCLEWLVLDGCKSLNSIPELASSISYINAHDCISLETVSAPQSPYDIGRCFRFSNCIKLVKEDVLRDIVETHLPPQGNPFRPFSFSLLGSEIPKQFIHRCRGSSVTARLPPNWFDNQFLGFAICAVTNKLSGERYDNLTARCFCTFKGDHCKYRFSFSLFDSFYYEIISFKEFNELESNHILVGYMPWSEFGINIGGEAVNELSYTEATFETQLSDGFNFSFYDIERCGVRLFFGNNVEDFGEPIVQVDNSERSFEVEPGTSDNTSDTFDEDKEHLTVLSHVFKGVNSAPSYTTIEDSEDSSSGTRKNLESWTQQVRIKSGLMQGHLDDGFNWFRPKREYPWEIKRPAYACYPDCWATAEVASPSDPTILEITYVGRHTCWGTEPMLTYQVRNTPDMEIEGPSDGFRWRKYGEMNTRVFYVCNPQHVGGCMAVKEVERFDDPKFLRITYRLRHTCTLPSTSIGGNVDSNTSVASSVHDQVNGSGENAIRLVDDNNPGDDDNAIIVPNANSRGWNTFTRHKIWQITKWLSVPIMVVLWYTRRRFLLRKEGT